MTSFEDIYSIFLSKVTDDMYMELTEEETYAMLKELLLSAIPQFKLPKVNIFDYDLDSEAFNVDLTNEEQNILATLMKKEWIGQQIAIVDNTRMMYTGSDFKMTSQANHISKLSALEDKIKTDAVDLQDKYKRRKIEDGSVKSSLTQIMQVYDS